MTTLRNFLAYLIYMRWPIRQDMPRWSYRFSLWLGPWAAAWVYRFEAEGARG